VTRAAALAGLALIGCIPQVEPPARPVPPPERYDPPPPESAAPIYHEPYPLPPPRNAARPRRRPPPGPDRGQLPPPVPAPVERAVAALPAPRPAWEARPVAVDAVEVADTTVTVRPGDTLSRVAERTGAGADAIARENGLVPPFPVRAGQRLRVPGGRYHPVRPGQTGIAIARAYGVEWSRVVAANGLTEPYVLRAGQRVLIPVPPPERTAAAERAAAFRLDIDDILTGGEPALASNQAPAKPIATPRRVLPATAAVVAPPVGLAPGTFLWPVDGRIVTRFGPGQTGERSNGINIAVPTDTPVRAAADGVVAYVGDGIAALGGLVIVRHGGNWTSVYGHAAKLLVRRGQAVKRGQTLALSGATGYAPRPQLHFELRRGRLPVDPVAQLPRAPRLPERAGGA